MFEILSTCSFSLGSWTVESALPVVCFTAVFFSRLKPLNPAKFDCGMSFGSTDVPEYSDE